MVQARRSILGLTAILTMSAVSPRVVAHGGAVQVPFRLEDNRAFVEVMADGRGPFSFIVDSGSSGTTISDQLLGQLGLAVLSAGTSDGAGEAKVADRQASLGSLKLGPVELGPLPVDAMSYDLLKRAIGFRRFDGVVGAELFRSYVVTFDFGRSSLMLERPGEYRPAPGAAAIPFTLNENDMPVVDATVAGVTGGFEVDTGDRSAVTLFGPFWRAHRLDQAMSPAVTIMTGYGVGGPIRSIVGRMPHFSIGDVDCPPPVTRLSLQKSGAFAGADYAGSIGIGVLAHFKVTFDYAGRTMYLMKRDPRDAAEGEAADGFDRSGMWIGLDKDDRIVVMDLAPNGPARRAGLEVGDIVRAVDGEPAPAARLFAIRDELRNRDARSSIMRIERAGRLGDHVLALKDQISPD
jgi:hypothetical protein